MATISKLPKRAPPVEPPASLSPPARDLWSKLVAEYGMHSDTAAQMLLTSALTAWDRAQQAEDVLDKEGLTITTPKTRTKRAHPCVGTAEKAWAAYHRAMRALDLESNAPEKPLGRPAYLPVGR